MEKNTFFAAIRNGNDISINEARFTSLQTRLSTIRFGANGYSEKITYAKSYDIDIAGVSEIKHGNSFITYYKTLYGALSKNFDDCIAKQEINFGFEQRQNCYIASKFENDFIVRYLKAEDGFFYYKSFAYVWDNTNKCVKFIDADDYAMYDFVSDKVTFLECEYGKLYKSAIDCAKDHNVKFVEF